MKWNRAVQILISCATLICGERVGIMAIGAPQGPRQLVRDLQASRKGDKVTLTWSQPRALPIREPGTESSIIATICRSISPTAVLSGNVADDSTLCPQTVARIDVRKPVERAVRVVSGKNSNAVTVHVVDDLPSNAENPDLLEFAVYTVQFQDTRGRRVGLSNTASVSLGPVLPAVGLHSELDARGVYLIWDNENENPPSTLNFDYRIYRSEKGSAKRVAVPYARAVIHTEDGERWTGVDTNIEWEKTYSYRVTPVTKVYGRGGELISEIEGDESAPVEVITHDVFPPAPPEGLLAVVTRGKKFVDLLWAPNIEKDMSRYNVYRREQDGDAVRINSVPVSVLSFQDNDVIAAHTYFYSISAVDIHGNESAKSHEAMAVLH